MQCLPVIASAFACLSSLFSIALAVWVARLKVRINSMELARLELMIQTAREAMESRATRLEYSLETEHLQPIRSKSEAISQQIDQHRAAISTLSGALKRTSDGAYVPRGDNYWPVQNHQPSDPREL